MQLSLSLRLFLVTVQFAVLPMALPNPEGVMSNMKPLLVSGFGSVGAWAWTMPSVLV